MRKIEVIGHRGARCYAPENTIAGMAKALEIGVDWVDVDVVATSDQVLIGYHNLIINPEILCDKDGKYLANEISELLDLATEDIIQNLLIKNLSFVQLQKYYIQLNPQSKYAQFFPKQDYIPNTTINSLQQIVDYVNLATNNSVNFQIEVKNDLSHPSWSYNHNELANMVYQFILKNDLIKRVKIQAFDWRILVALNQLDPSIKTAYLIVYDLIDNWQSWFQNTKITEVASKYKINTHADFLFIIKELGGYSYEPEDNELTLNEVEIAHKLGLKVYVWTYPEHSGFVFNENIVKQMVNFGIDGIITDNPLALNRLLSKLSQKFPKQFIKDDQCSVK